MKKSLITAILFVCIAAFLPQVTFAVNAPTNVKATAGDQQATITFTSSTSVGVGSYMATASPGGKTGVNSGSPIVVSGLTNGITYTFTVKAISGIVESPASIPSNSVVPFASTLPAPTGVKAKTETEKVTLSWNAVPGATDYEVGRQGEKGKHSTDGELSYTDSGLAGTYTYMISGKNSGGVGGAATITVTIPASTKTPSNVVAKAGTKEGEAIISFTEPNSLIGVTGYTAKSDPDGHLGVNKTSPVTVTHLDKCIPYTFIVYGNTGIISKSPDSRPSNTITLGEVLKLPEAPETVTAKALDAATTLSWTPVPTAGCLPVLSYTITSPQFPGWSVVAKANPFSITKLTNGKTYTFEVAATNKVGTGPATASNEVTPEGAGTWSVDDPSNIDEENQLPPEPTDISRHFQLKNPLKSGTMNEFLQSVLDALVLIMTPLLVLAVIASGFLFVAARGNAEKLGVAKQVFMYTLIGAALILGAKVIAEVLKNTFNHF